MTIDWIAFLQVFGAALVGASLLVLFYALGLRLLVRAGRVPIVAPADFTDAITVVSPKQLAKNEKRAEKALKKSPLTHAQRETARFGAYACFAVCALVIASSIVMLVLK